MTESSRARSGYADSNRGRNPTPVLLLLIYFYLTLTALIYIYVGIREVTMVHIPQLVRDTRERLRTFKFAGRGKDARQPAQEKKGESSAVKDKVVVKSESRPVPLTRKLTFNDLSQEVYEIISYSLTQADLLNMCLVSKHCLAHFERALYRTVILLPPEDSKWNKRSALFYLDPRFAEHTQDLRIVFRGRDKVRCSLPVSGDRKERRQFRESLATWKSLRYVNFRQMGPPAAWELEPRMPWFSHLLLAFSNLRALNLNGAWSFHDATIIHQAILKSRVTLRVLGIYRPQHPFIARISDSDPRPRERASLFWARLIELLTESVRAEREARDSDPRSGDKLAERVVGPPLRLDTLTINDDAIADFASLTDLASLRRLGLVHGSGALDILSRDRPLGQRPQLPQAAADCFHDAVGLELIESDYVDPSVRELMDVLKKAGNKTVRHVAINRSWDRRDWPPAPWADNRFS